MGLLNKRTIKGAMGFSSSANARPEGTERTGHTSADPVQSAQGPGQTNLLMAETEPEQYSDPRMPSCPRKKLQLPWHPGPTGVGKREGSTESSSFFFWKILN